MAAGGAKASKTTWRDRWDAYLRTHREVARDSLQRMFGSYVASGLAWLMIAVALALPALMLLLLLNMQAADTGITFKASVSLVLDKRLDDQRQLALQAQLRERSDVLDVTLIAPRQAVLEFQELAGIGDLLEDLGENPLPALLIVVPSQADMTPQAAQRWMADLQALPGVAKVQLDMQWLQRLRAGVATFERLTWVLGCLLAVGVVLVIGNTVRLAIEARRDEIVVIKLVGGTDAYVRRPFLYTGIWYGLGGGLLAVVLVSGAMWWLAGPVGSLADSYNSHYELVTLGLGGSLLLCLLAAVLGLSGSVLAVSRHLRHIQPR